MLARERQNKICEMIQKNGAVSTSNLVDMFAVSVETIRRDFLTMEENGLLLRVHGGAVANNEMQPFHNLEHRNKERNEQKRELAKNATRFVCEGDYIAIDTGSTALFFAEALKERFSRLTVVTHSVDVFEILRNYADFSVILCGGHYMKNENSFYGNLTLDMLSKLHVQKSFIASSAVSIEFGICDYQPDLYLVQKALLKNADNVYILADSSKFERKALMKLDDMKPEYYYITDSRLSDELKKLYLENNLKVYNGGEV